MPNEMWTVVLNSGIAGVMLVFMVRWFQVKDAERDRRDQEREASMTARVQQTEDYVKGELAGLIRSTVKVMQEFADAVKTMPCLCDPRREDKKP
jgi:hypothetical protein